MNSIKIASIVAVSVVVTLAIAALTGFQLNEIVAEETEQSGHEFAEGTSITGVFKFREGTEIYPFEVYDQDSGFARAEPFVFTLEKIVGKTPLLHKHADESFLYRSSEVQKKDYNPFDVDVILATGGEAKRVFSYSNCYVEDYHVSTDFDKEEGWMGKGFAVKDNFEIQCRDYVPHNPIYDDMQANKDYANAMSTMDLKEPLNTWSDSFKYLGKQ